MELNCRAHRVISYFLHSSQQQKKNVIFVGVSDYAFWFHFALVRSHPISFHSRKRNFSSATSWKFLNHHKISSKVSFCFHRHSLFLSKIVTCDAGAECWHFVSRISLLAVGHSIMFNHGVFRRKSLLSKFAVEIDWSSDFALKPSSSPGCSKSRRHKQHNYHHQCGKLRCNNNNLVTRCFSHFLLLPLCVC